jgi:hypothetical protein
VLNSVRKKPEKNVKDFILKGLLFGKIRKKPQNSEKKIGKLSINKPQNSEKASKF